MFKKTVRFVIRKEDAVRVIDTVSEYGNCLVTCIKDARNYSIMVRCGSANLQKCVDAILLLCEKGVSIRRLDVRRRISIEL